MQHVFWFWNYINKFYKKYCLISNADAPQYEPFIHGEDLKRYKKAVQVQIKKKTGRKRIVKTKQVVKKVRERFRRKNIRQGARYVSYFALNYC
jgi:hypothetical protein